MKRILIFLSIVVYSVFLGSQIAEGCLLVPYWKTLSYTEFYEYYAEFGPRIGTFYTILTICSTLIPVTYSICHIFYNSRSLKYSAVSTFFALLVIVLFYIYFKETNQHFYDTDLNKGQLRATLEVWGHWHWLRVLFEVLSLIFLILSIDVTIPKKQNKTIR